MNLNPNRLVKRLLTATLQEGKSAAKLARRKRLALESLEGRDLLAAMPAGGLVLTAVDAKEVVARGAVGGGDLAVWQDNYGAGGIASSGASVRGGGVDILIADTGHDRVVDAALLDIVAGAGRSAPSTTAGNQGRLLVGIDDIGLRGGTKSAVTKAPQGRLYLATDTRVFADAATRTTFDTQGRLLVGADGGIWSRAATSATNAPQGRLYVATDAGVFSRAATGAASDAQARLLVGTDGEIRR